MVSPIPETIRETVAAKVSELGYELFELRFLTAGSRGSLRVTIDAPLGVTISDCERVSKELSVLLDVEDFMAGRPYNLEVSSPGIDRPLKTERDFKRIIGRFVTLEMRPGYEGKKVLRGKVAGCIGASLQCEVDGALLEVPLSAIVFGKEEIQFK